MEHEITLSDIYRLLQDHTARFDRMDERFDRMDARFDRIDERFDASDQRMSANEARTDRIESVQNTIVLGLIRIEAIVTEHSAMLRSLQVRMEALHGLVEELERRTGRIDQEYVMITEALRRLETRFDRIESERLAVRIAALEARVQALETMQS